MAEDCCSFQLISGNGVFNLEGFENFSRTTNLSKSGVSYAVVAIMGPRSSGKSTLLNQLFQTDFRMMDAREERNQITQGIWIAKGNGAEPFAVAMDVGGTDGSERGQDGATFEKQSALFAWEIADIVMINMWCHDIGREHAANRPLLKTVFEAMIRLFRARKTTLLFVLRDHTKTPVERLERDLRQDTEKIWAEIHKPVAHKRTPLGDFFNVEITALPSYESEEEKFKEQVARLRQRFFHPISLGGLAGDRKDVQPASGLPLRAQKIWKAIKKNKYLDLPPPQVMVATFRCEEIAKEKLSRLKLDETWLAMREALKSGPVSEFGEKLSSIVENYLCQYDMEAIDYEESIRNDIRQKLETKALKVVYPAYADMLRHLRSGALKSLKTRLEKAVKEASGDGFEAFVESCGQSSMLEFERRCEEATIRQVNDWVHLEVNIRERLHQDIETLKSDKKAEYEAEKKKIKKEKIYKGVTTSVGVVTGVTVGTAMMLVGDPITATGTGMEASAAIIQLIDGARDLLHRRVDVNHNI